MFFDFKKLTILLFLFSFQGCQKKNDQKKKTLIYQKTSLREYTRLSRKLVNKKFSGLNFSLYVSSEKILIRDNTRYRVTSWLDREKKKSILLIGKILQPVGETPEIIVNEFDGIIDEVYVVRLGVNPENHLILISRHEKKGEITVLKTDFWDFFKNRLTVKWAVTTQYDTDIRDTYTLPTFHYWDSDDDGIQEVIITNPPGEKGKPLPWKLRWAVFRWDVKNREFIPFRGIVMNQYRDQNPLWLAFSSIEAARLKKPDLILPMLRTHSSCDAPDAFTKLLFFRRWKSPDAIKVTGINGSNIEVTSELQGNDGKYKIIFNLHKARSGFFNFYRICRARLFSSKKSGKNR
ncbi:MAG: hypothetical protein JXR95_06100 [Deltaproteobacteria bacterium]|nr:hypothetical protein [Deltaproteobacteria bacterium]